MRLDEIADRLSCQLEGEGSVDISSVATLEDARPGQLSFLTNVKYHSEAKVTKASALIVGQDCPPMALPLLKHENPYLVFAKAIEIFYSPPPRQPRIHPTAWISETASVGKDVSVGAYTYIGDAVVIEDGVVINAHCTIYEGAHIGAGTLIHSGSVIREGVVIGKGCIIQNNSVIGSEGFGYAKQADGTWYKIYQAGRVVIEDNVELGACTTIDRATLGETRISRGTKLDNLVHVGHGSTIGSDSLLCAQVGLAGSTKVGKNVILAGQVGAAGHLTIGDGVIAIAQTGIPGSVEPGKTISGSPAIERKNWLKSSALFAKLPDIQRTVRDLEKRIARLEKTFNVKPEVLDGGQR